MLTILGNQIRTGGVFLDGDGNGAAGGNRSIKFHRLFGDSNGDGVVNETDYGAAKRALSVFNPAFDFDNDGDVDMIDFNKFKSQMGRRI